MNIWLIKEGEPLPIEHNARLMRTGELAQYLSTHGHKVIWWSSSFMHGKKLYAVDRTKIFDVNKCEKLVLLHSPISYKRNVSVLRFVYHSVLAKMFRKMAKRFDKPDVIVCSWPIPQFAREAERFGRINNVPVILDVRDEWPDIFTRAFPQKAEGLAKIALLPLEFQARNLFRKARCLVAVQPAMLSWALNKAGRRLNALDQYIYIGVSDKKKYSEAELKGALSSWERLGVTSETWNICFYNTFSKTSADYYTIIDAVKALKPFYPNIRLIMGGAGDALDDVREYAAGDKAIVLPGWIDDIQIHSLLTISKVGVYPLFNLPDFRDAIGNKFVGYLSAGLPVLTPLEGQAKEYIEQYNVGIYYKERDVQSCANSIKKFLGDEHLRCNYSINARKRYEIDFEADVVNKKFETLIKKVKEKQ